MSSQVTFEKLPAIEGELGGCVNCGQRPNYFPKDGIIAVGFRYAALERDGGPVYLEPNDLDEEKLMTGAQAEEIAKNDPDHDWRIVLEGPLSGRTYQWHEAGKWALVKQNPGFA